MLILTIFLSLSFFAQAEITDGFKFLQEAFSKIEGEFDDFMAKAKGVIDEIELNLKKDILTQECKDELKSMKSVIEAITHGQDTEEVIFYAAKDIVSHFPGLRDKCNVPLPNIDTSKWDLEKFKKYGCALEVISFAKSGYACVNGVVISCASAFRSLLSLVKCAKDIMDMKL